MFNAYIRQATSIIPLPPRFICQSLMPSIKTFLLLLYICQSIIAFYHASQHHLSESASNLPVFNAYYTNLSASASYICQSVIPIYHTSQHHPSASASNLSAFNAYYTNLSASASHLSFYNTYIPYKSATPLCLCFKSASL